MVLPFYLWEHLADALFLHNIEWFCILKLSLLHLVSVTQNCSSSKMKYIVSLWMIQKSGKISPNTKTSLKTMVVNRKTEIYPYENKDGLSKLYDKAQVKGAISELCVCCGMSQHVEKISVGTSFYNCTHLYSIINYNKRRRMMLRCEHLNFTKHFKYQK